VHVRRVEDGPEDRLSRVAHERRRLQRSAMGGPRHLLHEPLQQRLDHVGRRLRLERRVVALVQEVGHEGGGQRMAVREVEDGFLLVHGDVAATKERLPRGPVEVAEGHHLHEGLPGLGTPGGRGLVPPGHHDEDVVGEVGEKLGAQPVVERLDGLDGVEEENRPPVPVRERRQGRTPPLQD